MREKVVLSEVIIHRKKWKVAVNATGSSVFVVIILVLFFSYDSLHIDRAVSVLCALTGLPVFGAVLLHSIRILLSNKPAIIITKDGIHDAVSLVPLGFITWEDINGIVPFKCCNQSFIGIFHKHERDFIGRMPLLKRGWYKINKMLGPSPLAVPVFTLSVSVLELCELINRFFPVESIEKVRSEYGAAGIQNAGKIQKRKIVYGIFFAISIITCCIGFGYSLNHPAMETSGDAVVYHFGPVASGTG